MFRASASVIGVWVMVMPLQAWGTDLHEGKSLPPATYKTRELPLVAGMPYEEAQAIARRYEAELKKVPGVYTVAVWGQGIAIGVFIHTDEKGERPATLSPEIQALPSTIEGLPVEIKPLYILPPPAGVVMLRSSRPYGQHEPCPPGHLRWWDSGHYMCYEQADKCLNPFHEYLQFDWRFCLDQTSIPNLMTPPVAGIPYYEALAINARHQEELMRLPGVEGCGLGEEGIVVYTNNPAVLPSQVEGLPVIVKPSRGPAIGIGTDLRRYD